VFQARSIGIEDFNDDCPVSGDQLGKIYRAHADAIPDLVAGIPERTRARLAAFLYGRSHTRELATQVAASCQATTLRQVAGDLGDAIHRQSRQGYTPPTYGDGHRVSKKGVSLAGSGAALGMTASPRF
jgi:hypothetical protein